MISRQPGGPPRLCFKVVTQTPPPGGTLLSLVAGGAFVFSVVCLGERSYCNSPLFGGGGGIQPRSKKNENPGIHIHSIKREVAVERGVCSEFQTKQKKSVYTFVSFPFVKPKTHNNIHNCVLLSFPRFLFFARLAVPREPKSVGSTQTDSGAPQIYLGGPTQKWSTNKHRFLPKKGNVRERPR